MLIATITSADFLAQTRVLAESLRQQDPDAVLHALFIGPPDASLPETEEPNLRLHPLDGLRLPSPNRLAVQFSRLELACALKAPFLRHLLDTHNPEAVLYLDSDIRLYHPPTLIREKLARHDIVLTPHFVSPDDSLGSEFDAKLLPYGAYNLGFLGLRNGSSVRQFLDWWQERVLRHGSEDHRARPFTDQVWINLVPGLFPSVHIERHPGLNVAHWNLPGRKLLRSGDGYTVNGEPLIFFHFSRVRPGINLVEYSWGRDHGPAFKALVDEYLSLLLTKGYAAPALANGQNFPVDDFPSGRKIPPLVRQVLRDLDEQLGALSGPIPLPAQEILRRAVTDQAEIGGRLRACAYHHSLSCRAGTPEAVIQRYQRSRWFRAWVKCWFYFFAPRTLGVPVEWLEAHPIRRRLRGLLDPCLRLLSGWLR
jgi:hypothetical protein